MLYLCLSYNVRQLPPYTSPNVRQAALETADPRFLAQQAESMQVGRLADSINTMQVGRQTVLRHFLHLANSQ